MPTKCVYQFLKSSIYIYVNVWGAKEIECERNKERDMYLYKSLMKTFHSQIKQKK